MLVEEAAKKLGMSTQTLRLALQQRLFNFGVAVKTSEKRWTYYINPQRLNYYLEGKDYVEENSYCNGNYGLGYNDSDSHEWLPERNCGRNYCS